MSRLEFRAAVSEPRPRSAWVLAGVASGTLWITQQLSPITVTIQALAILFTYITRLQPWHIQKSAIFLNICMIGITGSTIAVALQGSPATLSLAHFAALSQGLQLMDARPRKTEFLFVTLALFQVILAANLTDSVLFPPLLVAFLIAATWTLIVHTLRTEALEARDQSFNRTTSPPGLVRMTFLASAVSLVVALALFVSLPRMRSSLLQSGLTTQTAVSGFSDRVELGAFGQIRLDHQVVLRVETLEGDPSPSANAYWRGLAFDAFDGRNWSITPISELRQRSVVAGSPRIGVTVLRDTGEPLLVQRIVREPVEAGVLFGAGRPVRIEGPFDRVELDANEGLSNASQGRQRTRYTIFTNPETSTDVELHGDRAAMPPDRTQPPIDEGRRYLALPDFDPAVASLAETIVSGLESDVDRARAIETHLRKAGRYTDAPPPMGEPEGPSPVEDFLLGELAGHCEYFASGMVVLARSVGLPSRLVNGFAGGRVNQIGGFTELTSADAHAWVEVYFERAGWVRYDPTPPDLRLRAAVDLSMVDRLAELGSVIELWWFQRVVDFDSSDQMLAIKAAWGGWRSLELAGRSRVGAVRKIRTDWTFEDAPIRGVFTAVALMLLIGAWAVLRHRKRVDADPVPRTYARALKQLERRGLVRSATATSRAFVAQVHHTLGDDVGTAFAELTEAYLAERFGGRTSTDALPSLAKLRAALHTLRALPASGASEE